MHREIGIVSYCTSRQFGLADDCIAALELGQMLNRSSSRDACTHPLDKLARDPGIFIATVISTRKAENFYNSDEWCLQIAHLKTPFSVNTKFLKCADAKDYIYGKVGIVSN